MGDIRQYRSSEIGDDEAAMQAREPASRFFSKIQVHTFTARTVCQHTSLRTFACRAPDPFPHSLPLTVHLHAQLMGLPTVTAGCITYIYLHPWRSDDPYAIMWERFLRYPVQLKKNQVEWLLRLYQTTSRNVERVREGLSKSTTIIFAGLLCPKPSAGSIDAEKAESSKDGDAIDREFEYGREIMAAALASAKADKGIKHLGDIAFEEGQGHAYLSSVWYERRGEVSQSKSWLRYFSSLQWKWTPANRVDRRRLIGTSAYRFMAIFFIPIATLAT